MEHTGTFRDALETKLAMIIEQLTDDDILAMVAWGTKRAFVRGKEASRIARLSRDAVVGAQ